MAKISRYNGNLQAFGSTSQGTERTVFGALTQDDTLDANITADFLRGWGIISASENPTKQDFNGLAFTLGQLIAYLHQRGVPEWNTAQEYYAGSVTTTLSGVYRLKAGGTGSSNPDTDGGVNWESISAAASEAVAGRAEIATQTETNTGNDDLRFVTPKKLKNWVKQATESVLGMLKVATQAQTNAGDSDTVVVTPKKLRWGFSILLDDNGYIAFPSWLGGLIIQWGNSLSGTYSFPVAFLVRGFVGVMADAVINNQTTSGFSVDSVTQYTINSSASSSSSLNYWIALGH